MNMVLCFETLITDCLQSFIVELLFHFECFERFLCSDQSDFVSGWVSTFPFLTGQARSVFNCLLLLTFDGHASASTFVDSLSLSLLVCGLEIILVNEIMKRECIYKNSNS